MNSIFCHEKHYTINRNTVSIHKMLRVYSEVHNLLLTELEVSLCKCSVYLNITGILGNRVFSHVICSYHRMYIYLDFQTNISKPNPEKPGKSLGNGECVEFTVVDNPKVGDH